MGTLIVVLLWFLLYTFLAFVWGAFMNARHKRECDAKRIEHEQKGWGRHTFREPDPTPSELHGAFFPISILTIWVFMPIGRAIGRG